MLIKGEKPKIHFGSTCPQRKFAYWLWSHCLLRSSHFSVWKFLSAIFWPLELIYIYIYIKSFPSSYSCSNKRFPDTIIWQSPMSFHFLPWPIPIYPCFHLPWFPLPTSKSLVDLFLPSLASGIFMLTALCRCDGVAPKPGPRFPPIQKISQLHPGPHSFTHLIKVQSKIRCKNRNHSQIHCKVNIPLTANGPEGYF